MQAEGQADLVIKITASERGNPSGKLADVELHFGGRSVLAGLKLIGFSIWEGRAGRGLNVLFPARHYAVKSERRCFALLRPRSVPPLDRRAVGHEIAVRDITSRS